MSADTMFKGLVPSAKMGGTAVSTTETQFVDTTSSANPLVAYVPGMNRLNGRPFELHVAGRATGGTTVNLTIKLYWGTSATYSSNTNIYTTSTIAYDSASSNFYHIFRFVWDSTSGKLNGAITGGWNGLTPTIVTNAVTTQVSSVDLSGDLLSTGNGFTVTGTWSSSNANNAAYITAFELRA
jgi:hypothetical protein